MRRKQHAGRGMVIFFEIFLLYLDSRNSIIVMECSISAAKHDIVKRKGEEKMSDLSGKYAIVTGGNRGIGAAIVKRFLDDGCAGVAIFGRRIDQVKAYAAEVDPSGERTLCVACDVGVPEQVHDGVQAVLEKFGRIDILINNAGITRDRIFHKMTLAEWNEVLNTNLTSIDLPDTVKVIRRRAFANCTNLTNMK